MPELKRLHLTRIVAIKAALDALDIPTGTLSLRTAPDEILLMPPKTVEVADEYAIFVSDSSFAGVWIDSAEAATLFPRVIEWELPAERPAFAQGMVAGIPAKLWLEQDSTLLICPAAYAAEMEDRLH